MPAGCDLRLYAGAVIVAAGIESGHISVIFIGAVIMVDSIAEAIIGGG